MKDYFVSDEFASLLAPLNGLLEENNGEYSKDIVECIVGTTIKYYTFLDSISDYSAEKVNVFVKNIVDYIKNNITSSNLFTINYRTDLLEYTNDYFINETLNKLNLSEDELTPEVKEKLGKHFTIVAEKSDYMFHGFNGCYLDSIRENGINPNEKDNQEDIRAVNAIFLKYGIKMGLGWSEFDYDKVSYSLTPIVSYDYAQNSPEWFSLFVNGNNKNAFMNNDFEGAKNNIIEKMDNYNFSQEDRQKVMDFFVSNWQKYSNNKPMIAVVKKNKPDDELNDLISLYHDNGLITNFKLILSYKDYSVDLKTPYPIDTKDALFIELPNHKELVNKISLFKEKTF